MSRLQDLIKLCRPDCLTGRSCHFHDGQPPIGICGGCGKELCEDCYRGAPHAGMCPGCRPALGPGGAKGILLSPFVLTAVLLLVCCLIWLLIQNSRGSTLEEYSANLRLKKKQIALRNWLYLNKAVRLKTFAEYIEAKDQKARSRRMFGRARLALEQILHSITIETGTPPEEFKRMLEEKPRRRAARLYLIMAEYLLKENRPEHAQAYLTEAADCGPGPASVGMALFRLGRLQEKDGKLTEAIETYRQSLKAGKLGVDSFLDEALDSLAGSVPGAAHGPQTDLVLAGLVGEHDQAEVQYRIILCAHKLGDQEMVAREYEVLQESFYFSSWAQQLQKAGIVPKTADSPVHALDPGPKEDETMTIVPLED